MLAWILNAGVLWFVVWAALFTIRRRRKRKSEHESRELVVSPLAGLAMGAMLLGFQAIYQPQVRHMIVEEMKEERVDDDSGEPLGGRTFHEQLRRIRMGEDVKEVTVRKAP